MGADSWLEITSWHEWRRLMELCHFIVVTRPGYELDASAYANKPIPVVNVKGPGCRQWGNMQSSNERPHAFITDVVVSDISATAIRAAARSGDLERLHALVPSAVADYIEKYGLYQK